MSKKRIITNSILLITLFPLISCGQPQITNTNTNINTNTNTTTTGDNSDTQSPQCSVVINNGDSTTNSIDVTLSLSATDDTGVTGYYLSESSLTPSLTGSGWVLVSSTKSYSANVSYTLSTGSGTKTIYVWFRDAAGNLSTSAANDTITFSSSDTTTPSSPSVSINSGATSITSTSVTLTLSAADNVGVTAYYASETSTTPSASASGWTAITSTTSYSASVSFTLSSGSGTKTVYVWFRDAAGNVSSPASDSITFSSSDTTAPSSPSLSSPVTVASEGGQLPKVKKYGNNVYIINTDSSRNLKFYKSADNGASFTTNSTLATNVMNGTEFEFSMDSNGYLYALWEDQTNSQLYIHRSFDSGGSWNSATVASGFTWIDDPSYYFSGGTMYVLFRGYKNSKIELYLTKSTDNGATFSTPVQVTNNSIQEDNGSIAAYGSNVYVIYFDAYSASPYNIYLVKSINGGSSFGSPVRVNRTSGKSDFGPTIAVDGSGNVFVAYEDTTNDSEGDLFVAKSTDGGSNFTHTQAADSSYRNQDYPKISIDGSNKIYLLWNDNRDNVSYGSVYYTRSVDGGSTYETNINIRSSGGISNGSLYVYSNTVNIVVTDYNTSPYTTLFYKLMY